MQAGQLHRKVRSLGSLHARLVSCTSKLCCSSELGPLQTRRRAVHQLHPVGDPRWRAGRARGGAGAAPASAAHRAAAPRLHHCAGCRAGHQAARALQHGAAAVPARRRQLHLCHHQQPHQDCCYALCVLPQQQDGLPSHSRRAAASRCSSGHGQSGGGADRVRLPSTRGVPGAGAAAGAVAAPRAGTITPASNAPSRRATQPLSKPHPLAQPLSQPQPFAGSLATRSHVPIPTPHPSAPCESSTFLPSAHPSSAHHLQHHRRVDPGDPPVESRAVHLPVSALSANPSAPALQVLNVPPEAVDTTAMAAATSDRLNEELNPMGLTAAAVVTAVAGPSSSAATRRAALQAAADAAL